MLGVAEPGIRVWLRNTANPQRKYLYSWEMSEPQDGVFVGVHTGLVNQLVSEAIQNGTLEELQGYTTIQQEVRYGMENSRIDLLLSSDVQVPCYVEIKNVTARDDGDMAIFPDAVSTRGQKHLRELMHVVEQGHRAVLVFCIQRQDVESFRPADEIDPDYGDYLRNAVEKGVEVVAYKAKVSPREISLSKAVPVRL